MKLLELFCNLPEDYAARPLGNGTPKNVPSFDPMYSKVIGTQDSHDVWGSREIAGYDIYGFKTDSGQVVAYIYIEEKEFDTNTHNLKALWVHDDFRKQGLGSGLILFLTRKVGLILRLSEKEIVSNDARKLLAKLITDNKVKAKTSDDSDPVEVLQSFSKNDTALLIFESSSNSPLFGGKMILPDGRYTFGEHCLVNVFENSEYD